MKTQTKQLYAELAPLERLKVNFQENSMLYRFYEWLSKKKNKKNDTKKQ